MIEYFRFVETDQVVDDDVRGPEVVHHVAPHVDFALGPIGRGVQNHPGLGPQQLVRQPQTNLLQFRKSIKPSLFEILYMEKEP